jgi:hypothetical protein
MPTQHPTDTLSSEGAANLWRIFSAISCNSGGAELAGLVADRVTLRMNDTGSASLHQWLQTWNWSADQSQSCTTLFSHERENKHGLPIKDSDLYRGKYKIISK